MFRLPLPTRHILLNKQPHARLPNTLYEVRNEVRVANERAELVRHELIRCQVLQDLLFLLRPLFEPLTEYG